VSRTPIEHVGGVAFVKELAKRIWEEMDADNVTGLAAQMSYYFVLALFPFLIFLAALVGSLPFTGLWDKVLKWIVLYLPAASQHVILDTVTGLTRGHSSFLSLGLLGTVWASCAGLMNLMGSLNIAYEVRESRGFFRRLGLSCVMLFVLALLFLGSFALLMAGDSIDALLAARASSILPWVPVWHVGRWIFSLACPVMAVSLADRTLPDVKHRRPLFTPGTLFVVLAWIPVALGFDFYARHIASYYRTYGALGAFVILMVWIYLGSLIILIGAEINCELYKIKARAGSPVEHWNDAPDRRQVTFTHHVWRPNRPRS